MIKCLKIEEFVICELFRPYMSAFLPVDFQRREYIEEQNRIEKKLRKTPEYIIELLEEYPETKRLIFERLNRGGGVSFYRYLDMNCDVIQYVISELPKYQIVTADMVRHLRDMTGYGMMDCKKALMEANCDMDKAMKVLCKKPQCQIMI